MMRNFIKELWSEIWIIFFVGGAPMFVGLWYGGISELNTVISSLLANGFLIGYMTVFMVLYLVVVGLDVRFQKSSDESEQRWKTARHVLYEVGTGFLGFMRAGSGVFIFFPLLWIIKEADTFSFFKVSPFLGYGCLGYLECVLFAIIFEKLKKVGQRKDGWNWNLNYSWKK